eukprot:TRINITY_DN56226_c0_g1_i1.p1 TRINITY_DN56226_c0_g1~~TRINITY_DN56226_c0_g1_i1.p1  ORF type:complete len:292 (-),score=46.46 TRINITY_DN56226_c0_g1_i1:91-966(-)
MAFLTGVDLEGRLHEDAEEQLALPAPPRRVPKRLPREEVKALEGPQPGSYGQLMKEVLTLEGEDPLEELKRMVRRTRAKMDSQTRVLDGFISDVNQVKGIARSFSCTDIAVSSGRGPSPRNQPSLTGSGGQKVASLTGGQASLALSKSQSQAALTSGQASLTSGYSQLLGSSQSAISLPSSVPGRGVAGRSRGLPESLKKQLQQDSSEAVINSEKAPPRPTSRNMPKRSGVERSQSHSALLSMQKDAAPIELPARRAPPGASSSSREREASAARSRLPSLSRQPRRGQGYV